MVWFHLGLWEDEISPFPSVLSGVGSRGLSIALTEGQSWSLSGRAFFKNSLKKSIQFPQADYSKPLVGVSSPVSLCHGLGHWLLFLSLGTQKINNYVPIYAPTPNRLEDGYQGCHHPVHLTVPCSSPFLFPLCPNPNLCPFSSTSFAALWPSPLQPHLCPMALVVPGAQSSAQGNNCVPTAFSIWGNDEILPLFRALAHTTVFMRW